MSTSLPYAFMSVPYSLKTLYRPLALSAASGSTISRNSTTARALAPTLYTSMP
jgi:hypothetical protein